jgi:formylmethanofuran dehydrogenase subunit C
MSSRSNVVPVNVTTTAVVRAAACTYHGYSLQAGGSGATITIHDNASAATGTHLEMITIAANASAHAYYAVEDSAGGVRANNGIYFTTNNAVTGSIRVAG